MRRQATTLQLLMYVACPHVALLAMISKADTEHELGSAVHSLFAQCGRHAEILHYVILQPRLLYSREARFAAPSCQGYVG